MAHSWRMALKHTGLQNPQLPIARTARIVLEAAVVAFFRVPLVPEIPSAVVQAHPSRPVVGALERCRVLEAVSADEAWLLA